MNFNLFLFFKKKHDQDHHNFVLTTPATKRCYEYCDIRSFFLQNLFLDLESQELLI